MPSARPRLLEGAAVDLLQATGVPAGPRQAGDCALDIALDEAVVRRADAVVRVWQPPQPGVVLGVASRVAEELHLERCRADGLDVSRRSTGGGVVLLAPEVACFSVVTPHTRHPKTRSISGAYALAFEGLARAFRILGLEVGFERPGDVALSGRKIVGLAQARRRQATIVHGVVPVGLDRGLIGRYIAHPRTEPAYRGGRPHRDFVTTLERETGASGEGLMSRTLRALARGLCCGEAEALGRSELDGLLAEARRLVEERYGRDDWTYRL